MRSIFKFRITRIYDFQSDLYSLLPSRLLLKSGQTSSVHFTRLLLTNSLDQQSCLVDWSVAYTRTLGTFGYADSPRRMFSENLSNLWEHVHFHRWVFQGMFLSSEIHYTCVPSYIHCSNTFVGMCYSRDSRSIILKPQ